MALSLGHTIGLHSWGSTPYSDAITELNPVFYTNYALKRLNAIVAGGDRTADFEVDRAVGDDWATHVNEDDGSMVIDKLDDTPRWERGHYTPAAYVEGPSGLWLEQTKRNAVQYHDGNDIAGVAKTLGVACPLGDIATTMHIVNGTSCSIIMYTNVPTNQEVRVSFYVKRGTGINSAMLEWIQRGGTYARLMQVEYLSARPVGEWVRYETSFTNANFQTGWMLFTTNDPGGHAGGAGDVSVFGIQVEATNISSMIPDEGAWKDRNAEAIQYDGPGNIGLAAGTMAICYAPKMLPAELIAAPGSFYGWYGNIGNYILFSYPTNLTDSLSVNHTAAGGPQIVTAPTGFTDRNLIGTIIITYAAGSPLRVYINGVLVGTSPGNCGTPATVPGNINAGNPATSLMAKMLVNFDTQFDQTAVTDLHNKMVAF